MNSQIKANSRKRLARVAGQIAGIQKMVDADRACADVLQQIVAVRSAMDQLGITFLTEHLQTCVLHQNVTDERDCCSNLPEEARSEEIQATLRRFLV